jgi:hypothetical protein
VKTFKVTREPRYAGYDSLDGTEQYAPDEFVLLVDGQPIGGTYWCSYNPAATVGWGWNDGGIEGASWASWGPRGLSCGHATREAAETAQVREYATDPSRYDRMIAAERAEREAKAAARQARNEAERERRRRDLLKEEGWPECRG